MRRQPQIQAVAPQPSPQHHRQPPRETPKRVQENPLPVPAAVNRSHQDGVEAPDEIGSCAAEGPQDPAPRASRHKEKVTSGKMAEMNDVVRQIKACLEKSGKTIFTVKVGKGTHGVGLDSSSRECVRDRRSFRGKGGKKRAYVVGMFWKMR